jgi:hypothetical protein
MSNTFTLRRLKSEEQKVRGRILANEKVVEEGKLTCVIGLFLESEGGIDEAARRLGVSETLDGGRMVFADDLVQDGLLGDLGQVEIVSISKPDCVSNLELKLISWEPLYLDGDGCEIVGIYCEGFCASQIEVPSTFHAQSCSSNGEECSDDCEFNNEWWRLNEESWNSFEVKLIHHGFAGITFTGWLLGPPEIGG